MMNMHVVASGGRTEPAGSDDLTPSQQQAFDKALLAFNSVPTVLIDGESGAGKSTVLRALHQRTGGKLLNAEDILQRHVGIEPSRYEQVVFETLHRAIVENDIVYFDNVGDYQTASHAFHYHRPDLFDAVFKSLYDIVEGGGKKLVLTADREDMPAAPAAMVRYRPMTVGLGDLQEADYRHIFARHLDGIDISGIDLGRVYGFSRKLSGHSLVLICNLLKARGGEALGTEDVIDILKEQLLKSNVDVNEVEQIDLGKLVGVEEIVEKLDRTILLPLREPELASELGLRAKHGVLLYGPPGTGKTTIGRALAHMMQGKFFMIDGDFDHTTCNFFEKVQAIFEAAQRNAPSVIFIDDADVILTDPRLAYFGRYLLTQLDGLMDVASGRICVMMTAMDLRALPLALLRSGRMEVWLEMKLPAAAERASMIANYVQRLPIKPPAFDMTALGRMTEGFTPADLRRLVSDATGLLALDRHYGDPVQPLEDYLAHAADALRGQKQLADHAFQKRGGRHH